MNVAKVEVIKTNQQKILSDNNNNEPDYYIASSIHEQIKKGKEEVLNSDLDRVSIIDGREGFAGKSTLTFQLAYAYDPTFCLDRIVFSSKDFENALRTAKKGQAIVFDEAFRGLSSKGSISKENKRLVQLLMECRQRNLFIFIVLPSFFLLEKYVSIFRSQVLFHCYCSRKSIKRKYYKIYNYNNKKLLYILGKQMMSYYRPKVEKSYRFYAKFPKTINREDYITKKKEAFQSYGVEDGGGDSKYKTERDCLAYHVCINKIMTQSEVARVFSDWEKTLEGHGWPKTQQNISSMLERVRKLTKNK